MNHDDDERALQQIAAASRLETAPPELGERIVQQVAYRQRLFAAAEPKPPRVVRLALAFVGITAVAAAAAVWSVRSSSPPAPIAAERTSVGPSARPASGAAARSGDVAAIGGAALGSSVPSSRVTPPAREPCRDRARAEGEAPLIDDFEDGDDAIRPLERRVGYWRWARESDAPGTAPALLPVPRADSSAKNKLALHVKGGRLFDWGATVEVTFRPPCYDATAYGGVAFQARGPGRVYVALREIAVIPVAEGGICEQDCHNPHVVKVDLAPEWQSYHVRWADAWQRGVDRPSVDPAHLNSVAFLIRPEDTPYDLWFDDVRFAARD